MSSYLAVKYLSEKSRVLKEISIAFFEWVAVRHAAKVVARNSRRRSVIFSDSKSAMSSNKQKKYKDNQYLLEIHKMPYESQIRNCHLAWVTGYWCSFIFNFIVQFWPPNMLPMEQLLVPK